MNNALDLADIDGTLTILNQEVESASGYLLSRVRRIWVRVVLGEPCTDIAFGRRLSALVV